VDGLTYRELEASLGRNTDAWTREQNAGECSSGSTGTGTNGGSGTPTGESTDDSANSGCAADGSGGSAALRGAGFSLQRGSEIDGLIADGDGLERDR
jgi:hypothetical protein